jgi:hypothetical protein
MPWAISSVSERCLPLEVPAASTENRRDLIATKCAVESAGSKIYHLWSRQIPVNAAGDKELDAPPKRDLMHTTGSGVNQRWRRWWRLTNRMSAKAFLPVQDGCIREACKSGRPGVNGDARPLGDELSGQVSPDPTRPVPALDWEVTMQWRLRRQPRQSGLGNGPNGPTRSSIAHPRVQPADK